MGCTTHIDVITGFAALESVRDDWGAAYAADPEASLFTSCAGSPIGRPVPRSGYCSRLSRRRRMTALSPFCPCGCGCISTRSEVSSTSYISPAAESGERPPQSGRGLIKSPASRSAAMATRLQTGCGSVQPHGRCSTRRREGACATLEKGASNRRLDHSADHRTFNAA